MRCVGPVDPGHVQTLLSGTLLGTLREEFAATNLQQQLVKAIGRIHPADPVDLGGRVTSGSSWQGSRRLFSRTVEVSREPDHYLGGRRGRLL